MLPVTQTNLPVYHSEQHYPVIVKTEDFPHLQVAAPIVISEERPQLEPQTVAGDNLPVQSERQSYVEQAEEGASLQEEFSDRGVAGQDQEQRILQYQEEVPDTAVYQPDNIDEQTRDEQVQDEQIPGEEFRHEQIRDDQGQGVQIQVEQQVSDAPLRDHEQFTSEGNFSAEDSSTPWMQESTPVNAQQAADEFYTPNEQVIPQSQAFSQEYQEDSYNDSEPWVMVDYPPVEEQDNYFSPEDRVSESQQVEMESERYLPQEAEEEADYQYYNDEQRMDNDEVEEPQPAEVCTRVL